MEGPRGVQTRLRAVGGSVGVRCLKRPGLQRIVWGGRVKSHVMRARMRQVKKRDDVTRSSRGGLNQYAHARAPGCTPLISAQTWREMKPSDLSRVDSTYALQLYLLVIPSSPPL